ncbi:MAG: hypothetical protein IPJ41_10795 [Phycisphaerales bacterium]|nr:hypothetical protein [Phycisphaerales bacterium]
MKCSVFQRCVAVVCLVAFGLGQPLLASMGVRCTDASGNTRLEFACIKTTQLACLATSAELAGTHAADEQRQADPGVPAPCEDEPLGSQASAARLVSSGVSLERAFVSAVVATHCERWPLACGQGLRSLRPERDRDRPPDLLARLRSVILIV